MRNPAPLLPWLAALLAVGLAACDDEPAPSVAEPVEDAAPPPPPPMPDTGPVPDFEPPPTPDAGPADLGPADALFDPPVVVVSVETGLGSDITVAGVRNRVTCTALTADGAAAVDVITRVEIRPEDGWRRDEADPTVFVGEAAGAYQVTCTAPDLGLRDATPSRWEVQPGEPVRIRTTVEPALIEAGGDARVTCAAVDAWGNPLDTRGAHVTVSPESPGVVVEDRSLSATTAGRYRVACALAGAAADGEGRLDVLPGPPAELVAQLAPEEPVYGVGEVIGFPARVTDVYGNRVDDAPLVWRAEPDLPTFGAGRFLAAAEGRYTLRVAVDGPTLDDVPLEAEADVLVDAGGPAIACEGIAAGQMVRLQAQATVSGQVADIAGLAGFEIDGQPVALDAGGRFSLDVAPTWGLNVHSLVARDAFGNENSTFCAFFAADDYLAEDAGLLDGIALHLSQGAIDDGTPNNPITSLADLLRRVLDSPELVQTVHAALQAQNPIVPNDCRVRDPLFGACLVRFGAQYRNIAINGPNALTTTLVAGGIRFRATLRNLRIDLQTTGTISVGGSASVSEITVDLTFNVDLSNGRPRVALRAINEVRIGSIDLDLDGAVGRLFDGAVDLIFGAFEGLVRDELAGAVRGFLESELDALLSGVLDGLDLAALSQSFDVPTFDGSPPLRLALGVALDQVNVNAERLRIGISTTVGGATRIATPSAGVPLVGEVARHAIRPAGTVGAAVSLGVVNQVLHRLWRGGFFSFADAGGLLGDLPEGTQIGLDVRLPPAVEGIGDNRVRLHLGPAVASVVYPGLFDEPLRIRVAAKVTAGVELIDDALVFGGADGVQIESLDLVIDQLALAAGARESIERDLTRIVQAVADRALNDLLPAVPIPDFALPDDLAAYGVPRGTRLGLRNARLVGERTHFVLDGSFGQ